MVARYVGSHPPLVGFEFLGVESIKVCRNLYFVRVRKERKHKKVEAGYMDDYRGKTSGERSDEKRVNEWTFLGKQCRRSDWREKEGAKYYIEGWQK